MSHLSILPKIGYQQTSFTSEDFMETKFTISSEGKLNCETKTWSYNNTQGFTGNVILFLTDSTNTIIYATQPRNFKIESENFTRTLDINGSRRIDLWDEDISTDILKNLFGYVILHSKVLNPYKEFASLITLINEKSDIDKRHSNMILKN